MHRSAVRLGVLAWTPHGSQPSDSGRERVDTLDSAFMVRALDEWSDRFTP